MLVGKLECMGQVREEMLCYLQGRKRPDGYFFDLSQLLEAFFFPPLCQYIGLLVCWLRETGEKTARGAIIKGVHE